MRETSTLNILLRWASAEALTKQASLRGLTFLFPTLTSVLVHTYAHAYFHLFPLRHP
ncbi:hypothetical protein HETIRDRAFT_167399 [Heterobasidion irregulare TC 32-1]|uniref:Uncharacterized protein n=1 Tax=Heterobasidion irregulare (strain TC 32-1) TaxID=747525 RepID=W4K9J0_HETIT|nr:uncharacterized protein HETIRDRAFT_167399 [Heterobasidion irregulare TC 32-1]ETW82448.1 hypothetical protein HETIRDRAFT_167399 [Heterobasidion irregulare TC 32-1]